MSHILERKDRGLDLIKRHVDMTDLPTRLMILRAEWEGFKAAYKPGTSEVLLKCPDGRIADVKTIGAAVRFLIHRPFSTGIEL